VESWSVIVLHNLPGGFALHGSARDASKRNYGRLRFCHGYSYRNCAFNSYELTSPLTYSCPPVISHGTTVDDEVPPLSLVPRHSTASVRSSSSYGSFLSPETVIDRGRYKSGSDCAVVTPEPRFKRCACRINHDKAGNEE